MNIQAGTDPRNDHAAESRYGADARIDTGVWLIPESAIPGDALDQLDDIGWAAWLDEDGTKWEAEMP